ATRPGRRRGRRRHGASAPGGVTSRPGASRGYTRRVTDAGRFERGERYAAAHGVVTTRGVDTITGLDGLIYDFPGTPTVAAGAPRFVLHARQCLKDAHARGVVQGDITASGLLDGLGEVYIEGFGVPWRGAPEGDGARALMRADVAAMAKALLSLAGDDLSAE